MATGSEPQVVEKIFYFDDERVRRIARLLAQESARVRAGERVIIHFDPGARQIAAELGAVCAGLGARVRARAQDETVAHAIALAAPGALLDASVGLDLAEMQWADVYFGLRCAPPRRYPLPPERARDLERATAPVRRQRLYHTRWTIFYWPTAAEAADDGLTLAEYADLLFRACDQPWADVERAQARLIARLDAARTLRLQADAANPDPRRRTELAMDISGMTFVNSTIRRNLPGSEVFSAPHLASVEGTFFGPGRYYHAGQPIDDLYLRFEHGRVVEFDASHGREALAAALTRDEGASRVGEVALGTNRGLTRRFVNGLLAEKAAGSFHIALGAAYEYSDYLGQPVRVDNGNRSTIHWDLTRLMLPAAGGGAVWLDGEPIQRDGRFLDPDLAILNPADDNPFPSDGD